MEKLALYGGKPVIMSENNNVKSRFGTEELSAVIDVMNKGKLSVFRGGEYVKKFENEFAKYLSVNYAVTTTSGTTALHTALASLELPAGSEVAVPPLTFVSTASVVLQLNLKPVFVDIDENYCLSPTDLMKKISSKMRAIIPVHIYGHPANMEQIMDIARAHSMFVIEDACQAHGAQIGKVKLYGILDYLFRSS